MQLKKKIIAASLVLASLAGAYALNYELISKQSEIKKLSEESKKYKVISGWNHNLEIENNYSKLMLYASTNGHRTIFNKGKDVSVMSTTKSFQDFNSETEIGSSTVLTKKDGYKYVPQKFLSVLPGDKIHVNVRFWGTVLDEGINGLREYKAKVYFEGYGANELKIHRKPHNFVLHDRWLADIISKSTKINVPDIPAGVYPLICEVYAPSISNAASDLIFDGLGTVISRERIPVVIGGIEDKIVLNTVQLGESAIPIYHSFKKLGSFSGDYSDYKLCVSIPELGLVWNNLKFDGSFSHDLFRQNIPSGTHIYQYDVFQNDYCISRTYVPIEAYRDHDITWLKFAKIGPEFSEKLIQLREESERVSKKD